MDVDDVPIPSPVSSSLLDKFKEKMKCASEREKWPDRIFSVGSDKEQLQNLLYSVISSCLRNVSSETALKKNLIDISKFPDIRKRIESLNDNEVEELKNIVQNGDWMGLIKHHMCLARIRRRYIVMRYLPSETLEISC